MSENEETKDGKPDGESLNTEPQEVAENIPEASENETPPQQPSQKKKTDSMLYGTRKRRPGANASPSAKTLDQIRGAYEDDDIIEMDDLPTRSSAPDALIKEERSSPPRRRERSERREYSPKTADSSEEEPSSISEIEAYPTEEEPNQTPDDERPKRFDEVDESKRSSAHQVNEFRPTTDGKRATPKKRVRSEDRISDKPVAGEKKGFFAWLKSLFSSEPEEPETRRKGRPDNRKPNQQRRRGGRNRSREGGAPRHRSEGGQEGRRPRRNRRPRGEEGKSEGGRQGNRQRRRRRPQGERRQSPSE